MFAKFFKILELLALVVISLVLLWSSIADPVLAGDTQPGLAPVATSLPIAVHLTPGDELIIYCSGDRLRVENIDDLTGVARCHNNLEPEIYWPAVYGGPAAPSNLAQDAPNP